MNEHKFRRENLKNIKAGFLSKIHSDAEYSVADTPRRRASGKRAIAGLAAAAIVLTTAIGALAAGFDPIGAWQSLFERTDTIDIGERVVSSGISMNVQSLYTDGDHAILKMTLRDMEGERLSDNMLLMAIDASKYTMFPVAQAYDEETGEATCIMNLNFNRKAEVGDKLTFVLNTIATGCAYSSDFQPFDYDLYSNAMSSVLRPSVSEDEWCAAARANYVPAIGDPEYAVRRGGVSRNMETGESEASGWLPLDSSAEGEQLIHWLSILGVGYVDGVLHVQLRYNDLFGINNQYVWANPALIDSSGNIIEAKSSVQDDWFISGEILYCGYQELRFNVGDIENLKDLKLAWTGNYTGHVIDGEWSVNVSLDSIGEKISDKVTLSDHPDFIGVAYKLSSMYLETTLDFPAYALERIETIKFPDGREVTGYGFNEDKVKAQVYDKELAIVLKDGTKITPEFNRINFSYGQDVSNGWTQITSWHILDGSFDIADVAEVIIFGVSFPVG